jgi:type IV pilus assembly protein PilB
MVDEAPIVRVVNLIISQAISDKASDIHIEPDMKQVRVRYRVDGVLHDQMSPPKHIQAPMISRIKDYGKSGYRRKTYSAGRKNSPET